MSRKLDNIERDHYTPSFKLSLMLKDMRLVLDAAARRGVELKLVHGARALDRSGGAAGLWRL
jgi:3-hydroxyisobutyrate dehydrogenase-like beta-hydroxyacid dehydrogenase